MTFNHCLPDMCLSTKSCNGNVDIMRGFPSEIEVQLLLSVNLYWSYSTTQMFLFGYFRMN